MDLRKLKTLIELVQESGIAELEITEGEERVRISRAIPGGQMLAPVSAPMTAQAPLAAQAVAGTTVAAGPSAAAPEVVPEEEGQVVKSPMVGTFYRSPSPGAPSFVDIGQSITAGQTLCIIEAMKLLNEIESEFAGVVKRVLVENGQPVEYGQPLFLIAPG
jgi:acetyl-CoA carboxylase biotin carboxyl carrier protein